MQNKSKLNAIGLNVGRGIEATHNLISMMKRQSVDIGFVQEPHTYKMEGKTHITGASGGVKALTFGEKPRAAILYKENKLKPICLGEYSNRDLVCALLKTGKEEIVLISCYADQTVDIEEIFRCIDKCIERFGDKALVLHGDFNSRNSTFGDVITNERGQKFIDWIYSNDLFVCNKQGSHTFMCNRGKSIIDFTIVRKENNCVQRWEVASEETLSDHRLMRFSIICKEISWTKEHRYDTGNANWEAFDDMLASVCIAKPTTKEEIEDFVERESEIIDRASRCAFERKKKVHHGCWWWNDQLERLKKETSKKRRTLARLRETNVDEIVKELAKSKYDETKGKFKDLLNKTRRRRFTDFCNTTTSGNFWKKLKIFRGKRADELIMIKNSEGRECESVQEMCSELLDGFFPDDLMKEADRVFIETAKVDEEVDESVIDEAVKGLPNRKAPGYDGITGEIFKKYYAKRKAEFKKIIESCVSLGHFPNRWKKGMVVAISKNNNEQTHKRYRPITLLPVAGKCLEKIFIDKLILNIKKNNLWSDSQFGFTRGKSTIDAIMKLTDKIKANRQRGLSTLVLCLDISGAFDNMRHERLINLLEKYNVPNNLIKLVTSYLKNRLVELNLNGQTAKKTLTRGCAQGSRCGPGLFCILMNELLKTLDSMEIDVIAYADDIALLIDGRNAGQIAAKANRLLEIIETWGVLAGLKFNAKKTQAMFCKARRNLKEPKVIMSGIDIELQKSVKYLGLVIESGSSWRLHVNEIKRKAERATASCMRLLQAGKGIEFVDKIKIYKNIIVPICTYASIAWNGSIELKYVKKALGTIEQKCLTRLIKCEASARHEIVVYLSGQETLQRHIEKIVEGRRERCGVVNRLSARSSIEEWRMSCYETLPEHFKRKLKYEQQSPKTYEWMTQGTNCFLTKGNILRKAEMHECVYCREEPGGDIHILFDCKDSNVCGIRAIEKIREANCLNDIYQSKEMCIELNQFTKQTIKLIQAKLNQSN